MGYFQRQKNKSSKTLVEITTWDNIHFYHNSVQKKPNNLLCPAHYYIKLYFPLDLY